MNGMGKNGIQSVSVVGLTSYVKEALPDFFFFFFGDISFWVLD